MVLVRLALFFYHALSLFNLGENDSLKRNNGEGLFRIKYNVMEEGEDE